MTGYQGGKTDREQYVDTKYVREHLMVSRTKAYDIVKEIEEEYARQRFIRESQERNRQRRKRAQEEDWMNENVPPNTPPWMQATNRAIYEWSLMMAVVFVVGIALIILFIVAVNIG